MKPEDLLTEIKKAIRDEAERILARIAQSYPQKTPLKKNSPCQIEFSMGLWIIPDERRTEWAGQYPDADIDKVLASAAREMDGRKRRPPPCRYDRFLRARLRVAQAEAMRQALARRAIEERPAPPCKNAPECGARAAISITVGGAMHSFCIPCADKERDRQLREGASKPAPRAASTPAAPSTQIEGHIERIRTLLGAKRARPDVPLPAVVDSAAPSALAAPTPRATPEREPGCDDE